MFRILFALITLSLSIFVFAGHVPTDHQFPNLKHSIKVDGKLKESVWRQAESVELVYENSPGDNLPAKVKTTAFYFEDGENLYIGFKAYDPNPQDIRAFFNDRDSSWNDDQVSIMVDTFNDERRAYQFFVNPLGVQSDSVINEVNGTEDVSWNGIWDSAGHIDNEGYTVEMVIPLRILRFNEGLEHQIWGIEFIRFYPREHRYRFSTIIRERGSPCGLCFLNKIEGVQTVKNTNNFDLIPTLTLSNSEYRDLGESKEWNSDGTEFDLGADIRWGINQDVYLNATINPDFSQVEADAAQLSVNQQFSLFFPEKRTFFLDGADYFQSPNNLIHTRNIADPDFGVKLTGKSNRHAYGVILADDTQTSFLVPGNQGSSIRNLDDEASNIAIGRWTMDVGNKHSVGALVTHRSATDYENQIIATDGRFWISDKDWVQYQLIDSQSKTPEEDSTDSIIKTNDQAYSIVYRHQEEDWVWGASHINFGEEFRADLGFISQVDIRRSLGYLEHNWYLDDNSFLNRLNVYTDYDQTEDQKGKKLEEEIEGWINFYGEMQFNAWIGGGRRERLVENQFELERLTDINDPNSEPSGEFDTFNLSEYFYESFYSTGLFIRPIAQWRVGIRVNTGDKVDIHNVQLGTSHSISPEIEWLPSRHMRLTVRHVKDWLDVDGGELFNAKLTDLRFSYQFDLRHRLKLSYQYLVLKRNPALYNERYRVVSDLSSYLVDTIDPVVKDESAQLIYSYKVNPQTLIFLGYSSHGYQDGSFTNIKQDQRSFFAKFSYAFQM
ncbi:carbohydrate binding family 9 domain-containing protein [Pleionea sediminis]|uniref:carbohydrate binding family 9 domain-containing protein n=1 Tax=Pleionea sediminis TaxID=2569479 RepID=UPI001185CC70|nr:carbohydrate binding family 9 domain-containing protein [Pleionea sediminis]